MFSGLESPMHLLVVLIVAILVLGPKRLPEAARGLGTGIRQFKESLDGTHSEKAAETTPAEPAVVAAAAEPVTAPEPVTVATPAAESPKAE